MFEKPVDQRYVKIGNLVTLREAANMLDIKVATLTRRYERRASNNFPDPIKVIESDAHNNIRLIFNFEEIVDWHNKYNATRNRIVTREAHDG